MVQLFYYENQGKACRKILNHEGSKNKILLFADEGWARSSPTAHWILKRYWWSRTICKVTEVTGTGKTTAKAKMKHTASDTMCVKGRFKHVQEPDFKMYLSTRVSSTDFKQGYSLTGTVERGNEKTGKLHLSHFAMLRRKEYNFDDNNNK